MKDPLHLAERGEPEGRLCARSPLPTGSYLGRPHLLARPIEVLGVEVPTAYHPGRWFAVFHLGRGEPEAADVQRDRVRVQQIIQPLGRVVTVGSPIDISQGAPGASRLDSLAHVEKLEHG